MTQRITSLLISFVLFAAVGATQIFDGGVVNGASFAPAGLPNAKIAPGSIISIFGQNLAPAGLLQAGPLPLPTVLNGVSVEVTVGDVSVDCPLLFTTPGTIGAILPSSTPVGAGTLSVNFGAQVFSTPIEVAASGFGIFTLNQAGSGAAVLQNFEQGFAVNGLTQAINPSGNAILYGTGLGAVEGDPAEPCSGDCAVDVGLQIFLGGVEVTNIPYKGRSGCCVGLDQINFVVPPGVTGCYVPLVVVVDGIPSNYTTLSIVEQGTVCSEPDAFSSDELEQFLSDDAVRIGSVMLSRITTKFSVEGMDFDTVADSASASFTSFSPQNLLTGGTSLGFLNLGACSVFTFKNEGAEFEDPFPATGLDAGAMLTLNGPGGNKDVPKIDTGVYFATLSSGGGFPGGGEPFLDPGTYTFSGPGGADVGPFMTSRDLPELLTWTNQDAIETVDKSAGLTVTWTGGDPANERVQIFGASFVGLDSDDTVGAAFFCHADAAAGSFTVGPEVLGVLPNSDLIEGFPTGSLQVGSASLPERFDASGIDLGFFTYFVMNAKSVTYE